MESHKTTKIQKIFSKKLLSYILSTTKFITAPCLAHVMSGVDYLRANLSEFREEWNLPGGTKKRFVNSVLKKSVNRE